MARLVAGLAAAVVMAGAAEAQLARSDEAVQIQALAGELMQRQCEGRYTGDVVATQGAARMTSDTLILIGTRAASSAAGAGECEADRLIAEGRVRYTAPRLRIGADRGEYDRASDTITFTGDVIMTSGDRGVMRGSKAVYSVADETTRVTADGKPVRMIITPPRSDEG